jgi:preprotein translocase subunit YajC
MKTWKQVTLLVLISFGVPLLLGPLWPPLIRDLANYLFAVAYAAGGGFLGLLLGRAHRRVRDRAGPLPPLPHHKAECTHDPRQTPRECGMYHCGECGEMVLAGEEHPDYEAMHDLVDHIGRLNRGDLVTIEGGYFAVVLDRPNDEGSITVAVGNGVEEKIDWSAITQVHCLPMSRAHANFREWIHNRFQFQTFFPEPSDSEESDDRPVQRREPADQRCGQPAPAALAGAAPGPEPGDAPPGGDEPF